MSVRPCGEHGMKAGDIVLEVDGVVADSKQLRSLLERMNAGEKMVVTVWRDGKEQW
ncbi:PDZ domain-containing protein [Myxococcota bacterium]